MDTFKLPIQEIEDRFTKSELIVLAWSSQEQASKMKEKYGSGDDENRKHTQLDLSKLQDAEDESEEDTPIPGIKKKRPPKRQEDGMDMSKITGREAVRIFRQAGIHFPMIMKERTGEKDGGK